MNRPNLRRAAARALLAAVAGVAPAAGFPQSWSAAGSSPFLWSNQSPMGVYRSVNTMMMAHVPRASAPLEPAAPAPRAYPLSSSGFARSAAARMPERMAAATPAADRAKVKETYRAMLDAYDQLLRDSNEYQRLHNNVAGALTFLVAASHYAHADGAVLSQPQQEAILRDFNAALAQTPAFARLSNAQKQELFETAAIAGAYVLTMHRLGTEQGRPEHVRVAREVADLALDQVLGTSLSRLSLRDGLRVR